MQRAADELELREHRRVVVVALVGGDEDRQALDTLEFDKLEVGKIYKKNDLASHLTDEYHTKLFMNNILLNIAKER